jgi:hypothetical protein
MGIHDLNVTSLPSTSLSVALRLKIKHFFLSRFEITYIFSIN